MDISRGQARPSFKNMINRSREVTPIQLHKHEPLSAILDVARNEAGTEQKQEQIYAEVKNSKNDIYCDMATIINKESSKNDIYCDMTANRKNMSHPGDEPGKNMSHPTE